jgi:hypothetical protein
VKIKKSSRHSKLTGDFAEGLVLYWLSMHNFECARVDHVGIDLIASSPDRPERMGISVKCRSRYEGTERASVNLPADGFIKASRACEAFGLVPYYAVVVDGGGFVRCFLVSLAHLEEIAGGVAGGMRYWQMTEKCLKDYRIDPKIEGFELSWKDSR